MLSLFILTPLLILFILNLPIDFIRKAAFWLAGALLLSQILSVLLHALIPWSIYPDTFKSFFVFNLSIDSLTLVMLLAIGIVAFVALIVALCTIAQERQRFNFVNLLLICVIG